MTLRGSHGWTKAETTSVSATAAAALGDVCALEADRGDGRPALVREGQPRILH